MFESIENFDRGVTKWPTLDLYVRLLIKVELIEALMRQFDLNQAENPHDLKKKTVKHG